MTQIKFIPYNITILHYTPSIFNIYFVKSQLHAGSSRHLYQSEQSNDWVQWYLII